MESKQLLAEGTLPGALKKTAKEEQISKVEDMFQSIALECPDNGLHEKNTGPRQWHKETSSVGNAKK